MPDTPANSSPLSQDGAINPSDKMKWAAWIAGLVFVALVAVLVFAIPNPNAVQEFVIRALMSLAGAAFAAFVPGFLLAQYSRVGEKTRLGVQSGGAIAVFVLLMFVNPARLGAPVAKLFGVAPAGNAAAGVQGIGVYRGQISKAAAKWADTYGAEFSKAKAEGTADTDIGGVLKTRMHEEVKTDCSALAKTLDSDLPLPSDAKWEPLFVEAYGPFREFIKAVQDAHTAGTLAAEREKLLSVVQPTLARLEALYDYARDRAVHPEKANQPPPVWVR